MTKNILLILVVVLALAGCTSHTPAPPKVIAFGSCAHENNEQPIWNTIATHNPDLWVWLGDIVYGDTENMDTLKAKYQRMANKPEYIDFVANVPVIGIYDDHDYGINDGCKTYPFKQQSRDILFDFLKVASNHPARQREGAYTSHTYRFNGHNIKVLLLDTRYFRDTLDRIADQPFRPYVPNPTGDVLGQAQWQWLETELADQQIDLFIIGSSIQVISSQHPFEKWANFPAAKQRLYQTITAAKPKGVLIISGDRHIAEFSVEEVEGLPYPLYDFTSSGLTHTWSSTMSTEENQYRDGDLMIHKNFGLLKISEGTPLQVTMEIRGDNDSLLHSRSVIYSTDL